MPQGVVCQDADGRIIIASQAAVQLLDLKTNPATGESFFDPEAHLVDLTGQVIPPESQPAQLALKSGQPVRPRVVGVYQPKRIKHAWLSVQAVPVFEVGQDVAALAVVLYEDITNLIRKGHGLFDFTNLPLAGQAERALAKSEHRFRAVFEQSPLGIAVADSVTGELLQANPKFCELVGRSLSELTSGIDWMSLTHPDDIAQDLSNMNLLRTGRISHFAMDKRYLRPDGSTVYVHIQITPLWLEDDDRPAHMTLVEDISEKRNQTEKIEYLNTHDILTGLANRRSFEQAMQSLELGGQLPAAILVADINGLRLVNEAFGHAEGDRLIVRAAELIASCCRPGDLSARIGGDEFAILMPGADNLAASQMLWTIVEKMGAVRNDIGHPDIRLNLSLGYGMREHVTVPLDDALREAEVYMNKRKLLENMSHHSTVLSSIMATMYAKSQETEEHARRLARLSLRIGRQMGLTQRELDELELFAMLHDIGKIGVDDRILNKPGRLTAEEWRTMKRHPEIGSRIARSTPELSAVAPYILTHHERWDGFGYPTGLKGEEIPLLSRILALADAFDAMTENRIYRQSLTTAEARAEIARQAGSQFDPELTVIFLMITSDSESEANPDYYAPGASLA